MSGWPPTDKNSVYLPPAISAPPVSEVERRAQIAAARIREGLSVSDEILSEILSSPYSASDVGIFTPAERADIEGDYDRVERARAVLADAESIQGGLQVCWVNGQRAIRTLLIAEHDHYRRLLSEQLGAERVVVDRAVMTEPQQRHLQERLHEQSSELAEEGIWLTQTGQGIEGFVIHYLAYDPQAAEATLRERLGEHVILCYQGATNHTFSPFPFASWHAEDDQLHVFYGVPHNGERPAGCQAFEDEHAVVIALTIKDWRGAKTLIGGFTPSHATVQLSRPLGERAVIDDSANRVRPHWTQT